MTNVSETIYQRELRLALQHGDTEGIGGWLEQYGDQSFIVHDFLATGEMTLTKPHNWQPRLGQRAIEALVETTDGERRPLDARAIGNLTLINIVEPAPWYDNITVQYEHEAL